MTKETPGRKGPDPDEMPDTFEGRVAANTIRIRRRHGWTVAECAQAAGVSEPTWYKIESGKWANVCRLNLDSAAEALGVKVETLIK